MHTTTCFSSFALYGSESQLVRMSPQPSLSSRLARKVARVIPIRRKHPETTSVTKVLSQPSDEDSFGRRARDYGIIGLSFALPLSEAVPVVGGPIKAAIGGLLEVLKLVEVSISFYMYSSS